MEALKKVHEAPIPAELRPFFDHVTVESSQPAFMLIPLMFLAAAEASGGITQRHIDALPTMLLSMEVTAIVDDTVDRTPMRSGRMSFPGASVTSSATPFTGAMLMLIAEQNGKCPPEFLDATIRYVLELFSMFLWERQNTYPERALFERWLAHRYAETRVATQFAIDSSLALNGRPPAAQPPCENFSYIFQDVDDIVGLLERRDEQGENDDLQMGIVTRPLMLTLARQPEFTQSVEQLWDDYRPLLHASLVEFQQRHAEISDRTRQLHDRMREALVEIGVPEAVRHMVGDLRRCLQETAASAPPLRARPGDLGHRLPAPLRARGPERPPRGGLPRLAAGEKVLSWRTEAARKEPRTVCVFCSSSGVVEPFWFELASALGAEIGKRGDRLVFGGSNTGMMGGGGATPRASTEARSSASSPR